MLILVGKCLNCFLRLKRLYISISYMDIFFMRPPLNGIPPFCAHSRVIITNGQQRIYFDFSKSYVCMYVCVAGTS